MVREHLLRCAIVLVLVLGLGASLASAQPSEPPPGPSSEAPMEAAPEVAPSPVSPERVAEAAPASASAVPSTAPADEPVLLGDEQALYEEETGAGTEPTYSRVHPHEEPDQSYNFLGVFYRHQFVPAPILELFVQAAPSFNFPQMGLEYIHRKNGLDIIASAYYADFRGDGPFLGKNDPPTNAEWIESSLRAVMGSVTFLWSTEFNDYFALQYGVGLGVGGVIGNVRRTEAYPTDSGYAACQPPTAPGTPGSAQPGRPISEGDIAQYCAPPNNYPSDLDGQDGEHYGVNARRWLDGGKLPNLWFRAAPQIALRIKPMHQLVIRIDGGFDLFSGIFVGGALAIGF
jgi:hypothetical protein